MDEILGPDLGADVEWYATDQPLRGPLAELLREGQWDINKIAHYLPVYESAFGAQRDQPVRMLEIGVSFGGSLELWRNYFRNPDAVVVGIDYNEKCTQFTDESRNIYVETGRQQDRDFLARISDKYGPFDVILDDGSHIPAFTLASFQYLFAHALRDGGAYLIEDLHTCYSSDCPPPELDDGTPQFTEVIKHLIDVMHAHYHQTPTGEEFSNAFEPDNPGRLAHVTVPWVSKFIQSLEIHDAIAVIRRGQRQLPRMIRRWSRDRMIDVLNEDAAQFLDEHPHLGHADDIRQDWIGR